MSRVSIGPKSKKVFAGFSLLCGLVLIPTGSIEAATNSATLQWAPNPESDLAGYRVYHGINPGEYGGSLSVGNTTSYQFVNLEGNKTHYFTVTAYDTSGNESSPASEVAKTITGTNSDQVLTVSISGNGTISSSPAGVTCSSQVCTGAFAEGTSVSLTAHPNSGETFSGWGGSCSGSSTCVVALTTAMTVSASFTSSTPVPNHTLSVTLSGEGSGSVVSSPQGLNCTNGTCSAQFPQGTSVTLIPSAASGSAFKGWNEVCGGTGNCQLNLMASQGLTATFASENSDSPPEPKPNLPIKVNFQPSDSEVPPGYQKDDGSVFDSNRGYGWSRIVRGTEGNSAIDQTLDTFESVPNLTPGTWNYDLPDGTYYLTMVIGDAQRSQGPHWVSAEGMQLTKRVSTLRGEYLAIVDYPVEVKDHALSITLGGGNEGQTLLNFLIIQDQPKLRETWDMLTKSFGTNLVVKALDSGSVRKVNPTVLVKNYLRLQAEKEREMAKINRLKDKINNSGETVTLRNLLQGS